jgi:peptidyl-tRNA hydrolase
MNLSGKAVHALKRSYPTLNAKDILVVHDDLEHKVGNVRIKDGGSAQ